MDDITVNYILIFCAVVVFIIILSTLVFCCCFGIIYLYSRRYVSINDNSINESTTAIRMSELTGYYNRNLSTIDEEARDDTTQGLENSNE